MNRNLRDYSLNLQADALFGANNALYPIDIQPVGDYSARQEAADNYSASTYFDIRKNDLVETEEFFYPI